MLGLVLLGAALDNAATLKQAQPKQRPGIVANASGDEVYINCSTTGGVILRVLTGDITKETTDIIVNGRGPGTDLTQGDNDSQFSICSIPFLDTLIYRQKQKYLDNTHCLYTVHLSI